MSESDAAPIDWDGLKLAAQQQLARAYAPYSGYRVAAALLADDGSVHTGVNVENASYGLTICAERNAIAAAVGAGSLRFRAIVVVCSGDVPAPPCGACRQVLGEFAPPFEVRCFGQGPASLTTTTAELLPHAFGAGNLRDT